MRSTLHRAGRAVRLLAVGAVAWPFAAGAVNPDISVIGDTRVAWSEARDDVQLSLHEVEVAFVGPVNPYASAEAYVAVHEGSEFEIEEAKLILDRYFPGGFGLTIGKTYLDFGQINQVHTHAYPFMDRPLMHEVLFGPDGARDVSGRLDWIAPVDAVTLRATAGAVRGDVFLGGHGHDHGAEEESVEPEIGVSGRLDVFVEPSRNTSFLLGSSILHGKHDPVDGAKVTFVGIDGKVLFDLGPNRELALLGEGVFGRRDASEEAPKSEPNGFFTAADFRIDRRWNVGGFAESTTELEHDDHRESRYGLFAGLALMEESTVFRLIGRVNDPEEGDRTGEVILQALFGLGPHRPHRY